MKVIVIMVQMNVENVNIVNFYVKVVLWSWRLRMEPEAEVLNPTCRECQYHQLCCISMKK